MLEPQEFLSGASQAYMALCGFALVAGRIRRVGLGAAWAGMLIGIAIDIFASSHEQIKVGHALPIVLGVAAGLFAEVESERRPLIA